MPALVLVYGAVLYLVAGVLVSMVAASIKGGAEPGYSTLFLWWLHILVGIVKLLYRAIEWLMPTDSG